MLKKFMKFILFLCLIFVALIGYVVFDNYQVIKAKQAQTEIYNTETKAFFETIQVGQEEPDEYRLKNSPESFWIWLPGDMGDKPKPIGYEIDDSYQVHGPKEIINEQQYVIPEANLIGETRSKDHRLTSVYLLKDKSGVVLAEKHLEKK